MKKKLLAAMLLLTVHINGMDSMEESDSISRQCLQQRVQELNSYYQTQSTKRGKGALNDLAKVLSVETREKLFEDLLVRNEDLSNVEALREIIKYGANLITSMGYYSTGKNSPFYHALVEKLHPLLNKYGS